MLQSERTSGTVAVRVSALGGQSSPRETGMESMELDFDVSDRNGTTVLAVRGEIDVYTAPRLREKVLELAGDSRVEMVVDLEGVGFIDSTGLGVLVAALKRLRSNGGDLALVCTQSRVLKVFEITGLTNVFKVHDSVEAATGQ